MQALFRAIGRLAQAPLSVLINGETGTGKELVARALHNESPRARKPFVALNTAAIPAELLESELFGHETGAFTGATKRHIGRFEQADGGTLFLDEIGDMPLPLQTRLLRVLAENEFFRVGGRELIRVDVRVIAATHQDLEALVEQGRFRADLLHRLDVVRLQLPPLRERRGDIAQLAENFLAMAGRKLDMLPKRLSSAALEQLRQYDWPGNVREPGKRLLAPGGPGHCRHHRRGRRGIGTGARRPPPACRPRRRAMGRDALQLGRATPERRRPGPARRSPRTPGQDPARSRPATHPGPPCRSRRPIGSGPQHRHPQTRSGPQTPVI